jgi:hypothetical protein
MGADGQGRRTAAGAGIGERHAGSDVVNGLFWLIKYWIFDRYLFGDGSTTDPASQGER